MNTAILTIGDELLIGQVLNSNAQWLSEKLTEIGISVSSHLTVGDQEVQIKSALQFLKSADVLIVGGGLGPTHDDITMEVLSKHFGIPLQYDEEWIGKVEAYFKSRNRPMSENNKKQAYLLKDAYRIDNNWGTAAGQHFIVKKDSITQHVFVVPGVPHELKGMAEQYILPFLKKRSDGTKILKKTLLVTGIGESLLAQKASGFLTTISAHQKNGFPVTLAFLPSSTEIRLRLQAPARTKEEEQIFEALVCELKECCGKDFFGFEPTRLEEVIVKKLSAEQKTLSVAESCTGGLIAHRLTQVPGSSAILAGSLVAYQTTLKTSELGISPQIIEHHGVVSEATVVAMAEAIRKKWNTDFGLASTGYLGPTGGDAFAQVGTVWVAVSSESGSTAKMLTLENHRERNKDRAAQAALDLLRRQFGA